MTTEERTDYLDRDQLRLYYEQGCKPYSEWRIGSEYENFIFDTDLNRPVGYEGPKSISKVFDSLTKRFVLHFGQPFLNVFPLPPHLLHGCCIYMRMKPIFTSCITLP